MERELCLYSEEEGRVKEMRGERENGFFSLFPFPFSRICRTKQSYLAKEGWVESFFPMLLHVYSRKMFFFFSFLLTIHLPLVAEYDLPPAAGRVNGERLLEALLDLWRPNSLRVGTRHLLVVVELGGVELGDLPE